MSLLVSSVDGKSYGFSTKRIRNLYENYALRRSENYSMAYAAWITPLDYLSLTVSDVASFVDSCNPLDLEKLCAERQEIFLTVDLDAGEVVGHEGRHRMAALHKAGAERVAISIRCYGESGKYDRQPIPDLKLIGEEFLFCRPRYRASGVVKLDNLVPLSWHYRDVVEGLFGPNSVLPEHVNSLDEMIQNAAAHQAATVHSGVDHAVTISVENLR